MPSRSPSCSDASICRRPRNAIALRPMGGTIMRTFVGAAALLTLVACKQATTDQPAPTKAEATKIAEQAEGSFTTGNVDTIMRQYADGAVMFDASHPALSTDRKVQSGWARDFVSMKP